MEKHFSCSAQELSGPCVLSSDGQIAAGSGRTTGIGGDGDGGGAGIGPGGEGEVFAGSTRGETFEQAGVGKTHVQESLSW